MPVCLSQTSSPQRMCVTDVMDSDYVLFNNQTSTASPPMNTVLARRTRAMRQWGVLRADVDYQNAERCIQNMTQPNTHAWQNYVSMMAERPVVSWWKTAACYRVYTCWISLCNIQYAVDHGTSG